MHYNENFMSNKSESQDKMTPTKRFATHSTKLTPGRELVRTPYFTIRSTILTLDKNPLETLSHLLSSALT